MIDGFQEGLYGATIGEPVTLDLQFPDPYTMNEELSGKPVTFEVTVLKKNETIMQELDEDFMKENSEGEASNEEEYRAYIKQFLQDQAEENAMFDAKTNLYQQIVAGSNVLKRPDGEVEALTESLKEQYKNYVESNGANWDEYLEAIGGEEAYNEGIQQLAETQVDNKVVVFGLCNKEGLDLSDAEYTEELMKYVEAAGGESIKDFEHLRIRGLMTIAPYTEDPESNRQYFRGLKELLNKANEMKLTKEPMDTLSMGMTGDYEVAIEEGATFVRVGTGIFGERNYAI
jgi:FKBP-type peptidyl-prolyl cis-trans isomerase (trigger factor)